MYDLQSYSHVGALVPAYGSTATGPSREVIITIDGSERGHYVVDCDCNMKWQGAGPMDKVLPMRSPAIAVAECVAHWREAHKEDKVVIRFSKRFCGWLLKYWDAYSAAEIGLATR